MMTMGGFINLSKEKAVRSKETASGPVRFLGRPVWNSDPFVHRLPSRTGAGNRLGSHEHRSAVCKRVCEQLSEEVMQVILPS